MTNDATLVSKAPAPSPCVFKTGLSIQAPWNLSSCPSSRTFESFSTCPAHAGAWVGNKIIVECPPPQTLYGSLNGGCQTKLSGCVQLQNAAQPAFWQCRTWVMRLLKGIWEFPKIRGPPSRPLFITTLRGSLLFGTPNHFCRI